MADQRVRDKENPKVNLLPDELSGPRGDDGISEYGNKVENRDFGRDTNKHYYFSITAFDVEGNKGVASHGGGGKVGQELEVVRVP
nr:hypothetical protein [Tanacetum cinerariifolium]